jgi:hypothetical protein
MPEKRTIQRARRLKKKGRSPSTQAGEFVREEIHHIREGKHGATSAKQAIAIGLSKARRAGVKLRPPKPGETSARTRKSAQKAYRKGQEHPRKKPSPRRSRAALRTLKGESKKAASTKSLSKQARKAARKRPASKRKAAAKKAVRTKGPAGRRAAARKAARTRKRKA